MMRKLKRLLHNLSFDLRYGAFLGGSKKTPYAHLGAKDTMNSDYGMLPLILDQTIKRGDVFVDIGCGRGRVLNYVLNQDRAAKIYGLELDPAVAEEVAHRLRRYTSVQIIPGDSLETLPPDATVLYAYNPFSRELMIRLKARILSLYGNNGGLAGLRFVYYNAVDVDLFSQDPVCIVTPFTLPVGFHPAVLIQFNPSHAPS